MTKNTNADKKPVSKEEISVEEQVRKSLKDTVWKWLALFGVGNLAVLIGIVFATADKAEGLVKGQVDDKIKSVLQGHEKQFESIGVKLLDLEKKIPELHVKLGGVMGDFERLGKELASIESKREIISRVSALPKDDLDRLNKLMDFSSEKKIQMVLKQNETLQTIELEIKNLEQGLAAIDKDKESKARVEELNRKLSSDELKLVELKKELSTLSNRVNGNGTEISRLNSGHKAQNESLAKLDPKWGQEIDTLSSRSTGLIEQIAELKKKLDDNKKLLAAMDVMPVGTILPWHKSLKDNLILPEGWYECTGDKDGKPRVIEGVEIPVLNSQKYAGGRGIYLRGGEKSGEFNESTYWTDNGNGYRWSYTSKGGHSGGAFARLHDLDTAERDGRLPTYTSDKPHGDSRRFQVAAMTVVWIIKIK